MARLRITVQEKRSHEGEPLEAGDVVAEFTSELPLERVTSWLKTGVLAVSEAPEKAKKPATAAEPATASQPTIGAAAAKPQG